jgi:hypothetical protein
MNTVNIQEKIAEIPDSEISSTWTFNILEKNSASSSLIILAKETHFKKPICLKTWCDSRKGRPLTKSEGGLEYEKKVYSEIIKYMSPREPLLRCLGDDDSKTTVLELAKFIGATQDAENSTLILAFFVTNAISTVPGLKDKLEIANLKHDYMSQEFYRQFFRISNLERPCSVIWNTIPTWPIGSILLPCLKFITFGTLMKKNDELVKKQQIAVFKNILRGIYTINKVGLVHNDLHMGNIMVEERSNNVMIYDWDRSYSPQLGHNPFLNDDPRVKPCNESQCNLFMKDRPIDLLKLLLCLSFFTRDKFDMILKKGLHIKNFYINENKTKYDLIFEGIKQCSPLNIFYTNSDGVSSLYQPGSCGPLEIALGELGGTLELIHNRAIASKEKIPEDILSSLTMSGTKFGFRDAVETHRSLTTEQTSLTKEQTSLTKEDPMRVKKSMLKQETSLTKEQRQTLKKLQKIPKNKLTWENYFKLKDLLDTIKYGPPVKTKRFKVQSKPVKLNAVEFWEILQENENRKLM